MYSKTVNGHTFLERSANHSTKGSRRGFELLNHGENPASVLTPEEQRHSLVRRLQQIELTLQSMGKKDLRRSALGKEKLCLQNKIHELRPKLKGDKDVAGHFISVARERLPKALFNAIMDESAERARQCQAGHINQSQVNQDQYRKLMQPIERAEVKS